MAIKYNDKATLPVSSPVEAEAPMAKPPTKQSHPSIEPNQQSTEKRGRGRPSSGKILVTLRLDTEVVQRFKTTGKGWQGRMNEALRKAVGL